MATRQRSSFQKRQKEMKRQEKQRMKADRRLQKSLAKRAASDVTHEVTTAPATPEPLN